MSETAKAADDWEVFLDEFTARLTTSVYPLALRLGGACSWLDLEIDLWTALADTARRWRQELPRAGSADDLDMLWGIFLVELTRTAFQVARRQGASEGPRDGEAGLYRAVHAAVAAAGRETSRPFARPGDS